MNQLVQLVSFIMLVTPVLAVSYVEFKAYTTRSGFSKGPAMKMKLGSFTHIATKFDGGSNPDMHRFQVYDLLTGYEVPEFQATTGEKVKISQMCPYQFGPTNVSTYDETITFDADPKKAWRMKPWGVPILIGAALLMDITTGKCDQCSGNLGALWNIGLCTNSLIGSTCTSYTTENWPSRYISPGRTYTIELGTFGGIFELHNILSGVVLWNSANVRIGISSVRIYDPVLDVTHCVLETTCNNPVSDECNFFVQPGDRMIVPCITPTNVISFTNLPSSFVSAASAIIKQLNSVSNYDC
jgi:hypothetical protein